MDDAEEPSERDLVSRMVSGPVSFRRETPPDDLTDMSGAYSKRVLFFFFGLRKAVDRIVFFSTRDSEPSLTGVRDFSVVDNSRATLDWSSTDTVIAYAQRELPATRKTYSVSRNVRRVSGRLENVR